MGGHLESLLLKELAAALPEREHDLGAAAQVLALGRKGMTSYVLPMAAVAA